MMLNVLTALVEEFSILKKKFVNAQKEQDGMDLAVQPWNHVNMDNSGIHLPSPVNVCMITIKREINASKG